MARIIVIPTVEVLIIFDRKDLLEKDEPIQDGGTDTARDRDNGLHPVWEIRCECQRGKSSDRGPGYGMEALDPEVVQEKARYRGLVRNRQVRESRAIGGSSPRIDRGRPG